MIRHLKTPPDPTRGDARTVVITVRHVGETPARSAVADAAVAARAQQPWPEGLLSWSLFAGTDGRALMAYEQWSGDGALDAALAAAPPFVPGIPGTEPSAPVRFRLERSRTSAPRVSGTGCVVTPVFDVDGPERQRHFLDELFAMTEDVPPMRGAIAAHFHLSADGTRVFNYAEWSDEQAHVDALAAEDPRGVRQRVGGEIPGVRPCGYRRWSLHTSLVTAGHDDAR